MKDPVLMHGDCLVKMRDIPDASVDLVLCDPPYGTTSCKWDTIIPFEPMWEELKRVLKLNGVIVIFGTEPFSSRLRLSNLSDYKYDWIWNKKQTGNPFLAKKQPLKVHELVSVFGGSVYNPIMREGVLRNKGGAKRSLLYGTHTTTTRNNLYFPVSILEVVNGRLNKLHPTQKPLQLLEYLVKTYTNTGDTVLDFAMGSGTTGVACKSLGRDFIGIEKEDHFFNIARKRIFSHNIQ